MAIVRETSGCYLDTEQNISYQMSLLPIIGARSLLYFSMLPRDSGLTLVSPELPPLY